MTTESWTLIVVFTALVAAGPMGLYLTAAFDGRRTCLSPVMAPLERGFYRLAGVKTGTEHDWKGYAAALVALSLASTLALFELMLVQHLLPLNPQGFVPEPLNLASKTPFAGEPILRDQRSVEFHAVVGLP